MLSAKATHCDFNASLVRQNHLPLDTLAVAIGLTHAYGGRLAFRFA
jgi:hypothetical protein